MPVDRLIPNETILNILNKPLDENCYYMMQDVINGNLIGIPAGIILLTKRAFYDSGMFDEDFCGNYGNDDILFKTILAKNHNKINTEWKLEALPHASFSHGLSRDIEVNKNLLNDKLKNIIPVSNNHLRFTWKKII